MIADGEESHITRIPPGNPRFLNNNPLGLDIVILIEVKPCQEINSK